MNSLYFWLIFMSLYGLPFIQCDEWWSLVEGNKTSDLDLFYDSEKPWNSTIILGAADSHPSFRFIHKVDDIELFYDSEKPTIILGPRVCKKNKVVMVTDEDLQLYNISVHTSFIKRCDTDISGYCSSYRVTNEISFRTVQTLSPSKRTVYECCPGWKETDASKPSWNKELYDAPDCDTDVDECEQKMHGCDQKCVNTPGSYYCLCNEGFSLQSDKRSCKVEFTESQNISGTVAPDLMMPVNDALGKRRVVDYDIKNFDILATAPDTLDYSGELGRKMTTLQQGLSVLEDQQKMFIPSSGNRKRRRLDSPFEIQAKIEMARDHYRRTHTKKMRIIPKDRIPDNFLPPQTDVIDKLLQ